MVIDTTLSALSQWMNTITQNYGQTNFPNPATASSSNASNASGMPQQPARKKSKLRCFFGCWPDVLCSWSPP